MITKENLEKLEKHTKAGHHLTRKTLKEFGFHIGEIAYLIETGILIERKDGQYDYLEIRKPDTDTKDFSLGNQTTAVLLSILLREKKRIEIDTKDADWRLLTEKSNLLEHKKGIIILNAMPEERRHKIYRFVKAIPCLVAFPIDPGSDNKRVVLKFHIDREADISKLIEEGNKAYRKKYFYQSIDYYLKAFTYIRKPSAYLYGKLGLSYMQVGQTRKAADFLSVAESLYEREKKKKDFDKVIEELRKKNDTNGSNFFRPFAESEFQNNTNEYYGLKAKAIEEMADLISSGKTIDEVASNFSLNEEQKTLLMLIFARNCYVIGDFFLGDKYLKQAEKRKHKTEQAKRLLDEIRKNKRFYQNRKEEGIKIFTITK